MIDRKSLFDVVRPMLLARGSTFQPSEIAALDRWCDAADKPSQIVVDLVAKVTPSPKGKFVLSETSLKKLSGVQSLLATCVKRAINYSATDFGVNQGARSIEEQRKAVASGHSRTMNSKHIPDASGVVRAVDLVAYVAGKVSWQFELYADIAYAMDKAATELGIASHIRWGCAWDRVLSDFGGEPAAYLAEAKAYAKRHAGSDLLDAPHFEWVP